MKPGEDRNSDERMQHDTDSDGRFGQPGRPGARGVALIAVLAVLTVLSVTALMFAVYTSIERTTVQTSVAGVQAELLAASALEHACSVLQQDAQEQPAWDDVGEEWRTAFAPVAGKEGDAVNVSGLPSAIPGGSDADARWIYVHAGNGRVIGRYAVLIEDEAGKINVNVAAALSPRNQDEGVGPFELLLTDGKEAGLPVSLLFGKKMLRWRYGRDGAPGRAQTDDNLTESCYAADEIDNDGDGIVDEPGEGVDEPEEYDPLYPRWDDRAFSSVQDALNQCQGSNILADAACRLLKRYATAFSRSRDMYWDTRDESWHAQVNLNVASKDQVRKLMRRANEETRFEPSAKNMRILNANLVDYRDENHVLTTFGSEYGVEAVCFNEVMANDGSYTTRADSNDSSYDQYERCYRYGYWYEVPWGRANNNYDCNWQIKAVGGPDGPNAAVVTNGVEVTFRHSTTVRLSAEPLQVPNREAFNVFKNVMAETGGWPIDLWKNAWLMVYKESIEVNGRQRDIYRHYPILGNTKDELQVGFDDSSEITYAFLRGALTGTNSVRINNLWRLAIHTADGGGSSVGGVYSVFPQVSDYWAFPVKVYSDITPPRNLYYTVYIGEQNLPGNDIGTTYIFNSWEDKLDSKYTPWKGFNEMLDVDGNPRKYSETRMAELRQQDLKGTSLQLPGGQRSVFLLRTPYKDGEPVRARGNFVHVLVSTCKQTGYGQAGGVSVENYLRAYQHKNVFQSAYMMRPDIIELINISSRPISLRNWRVMINTGSYADQVGVISSAPHYSVRRGGQYDDPNPAVPAGGYFYLTNKRDIFDREYGSPKDGRWGTSSSESYPCYELPDELWGVRYKVSAVNRNLVTCEGAQWTKDQMKNEMSEWHLRQPRSDQNSAMGIRNVVWASGRRTLDYGANTVIQSLKAGDDIVILGMPREGGFLSMTLKDQYGQIAARTIDYGITKLNEIGYSTEKVDPTHYTWKKTSRPTFGGTDFRARNRSMPRGAYVAPHVKDNAFVSVGEVQRVRKAEDWENIGMESRGKPSTTVIKAIGKYFTVSGVRLDPEEEGVWVSGWRRAFDRTAAGGSSRITAESAMWEPGIWVNQRVRILSGEQKGEQYAIMSSGESSILVDGYSTPGQKQLRVSKGDLFSVGPGYATPLFYTRKNGDEGIWEWKNKGLARSNYGLYLFGLNDAIDTTEFLEENNNAELEVAVFNFDTRAYDRLPLEGERSASAAALDAYRMVTGAHRHKYDKSDGVYCGRVHPQHISPNGGLRLRVTAFGLESQRSSGFAWFDYAYLAPGYVNGKININTASERAVLALPRMTAETARNIINGTDSASRNVLKPYKNVTDVLDVKGMTPDLFSCICNLITTRSDQFSIHVVAETLQDVDADGRFDPHGADRILSHRTHSVVVDRSELTDDDPATTQFNMLTRE